MLVNPSFAVGGFTIVSTAYCRLLRENFDYDQIRDC